MSQVLESIRLALSSIWANKLRSLLTLLGNIVAVSSIITVVALITGVNGAVSDAIVSDLGAEVGHDRLHERVGRRRFVNRVAEREVDDADSVLRPVGDGPLHRRDHIAGSASAGGIKDAESHEVDLRGYAEGFALVAGDDARHVSAVAVRILWRRREATERKVSKRHDPIGLLPEVAGGVDSAIEIGVVDEKIDPSHTRSKLTQALAEAPARRGRHKNIPL